MRFATKVSMFLVLALMLVGPMTVGSGAPVSAQDDDQLKFVFVTHDLAPAFAPVRRGMEDVSSSKRLSRIAGGDGCAGGGAGRLSSG